MTKPLYSTGSENFAVGAALPRPNSALKKYIVSLRSSRVICASFMLLFNATRRIPCMEFYDAESLLGDLLSFDFRSAKGGGLCQAGAARGDAVRRPLYSARHGGRRLRIRATGTHRNLGISEPGEGDGRL